MVGNERWTTAPLNATPFKPAVERWRGTIVNWAFALIIFTIIGINRDLLLRQPSILLIGTGIGVLTTFGLGIGLDVVLHRIGYTRARRVSAVLLGTIKNTSLAAATALTLFSERTAVPAAAVSAVNVLYMVWLGIWLGRGRKQTSGGMDGARTTGNRLPGSGSR